MRLALLFGGISYEHEISIISAITLKKALSNEEPLFIFLDSENKFYLIPSEKMVSTIFSSGEYKKEREIQIKNGGFEFNLLFRKIELNNLKVMNLIHGGQGEDGTIISLLEFYKIESISPRKEASILSFNKELTKIFAKSLNIKTVSYEILEINGRKDIKTNFPLIVKPLSLGSSIGVSVVEKESDFKYALDTAFEYENRVIIEPFIENVKEFNLAGTFTTELITSNIEEPKKDKFLDFDSKYMDFSRDETIEKANISEKLEKDMRDIFKKIYNPLFLGSLIRCDFFVIDDEVILNEINSIPGSMANYLFPDFSDIIKNIQTSTQKEISISYKYIDKIQRAK